MPAIKAVNSKNLSIVGCTFSGFETDIELENVEGFISKDNSFSAQDSPQQWLDALANQIQKSGMPSQLQKQLFSEIIANLSHRGVTKKNQKMKEDSLKKRIVNYAGDKALDFFIQLVAAVAAGLIIRPK